MKDMHWFDIIRLKTAEKHFKAMIDNDTFKQLHCVTLLEFEVFISYLNCSVDSFYISKLVTCAESYNNRIVVFNVVNAFLGKNKQEKSFDNP